MGDTLRHSLRLMPLVISVFITSLLTLTGGCARRDVAATVNREVITVADVDKRMSFYDFVYGHGLQGEAYLKNRGKIVDAMIYEEILFQEARRRQTIPSQTAVDQEYKKAMAELVKKVAGGSQKEFNRKVQTAGLTEADWKRYIERQMAIGLLYDAVTRGIKATETEMRAYFDANKMRLSQPEQVKLLEIRVNSPQEGEKALAELKAGASFSEVARKYSVDPVGKRNGGEVGYVSRGHSGLIREVEEAAFSLNIGETSGLVQSAHGLHILRVVDRKAAKEANFEELRAEIERQVTEAKKSRRFDEFLEELRRRAVITRAE